MIAMKILKSNEASNEVKCSACGGTGFPMVAQPAQAGRRIYPPPCKLCSGKGRIRSA
jgi:DnaJ-class molecular chaperone